MNGYMMNPHGNGTGNGTGIPADLARVLGAIMDSAKRKPWSMLDYAVSYIGPILDGRVSLNDAQAMGTQLLYVLSNIGTWRGPEAKEGKLVIKKYLKHYKAPGFENNPGNGERPPYEPFSPEAGGGGSTVISGPKQTAMFRILQIKHGLKLELKGIRMSRHGSLFAMVKREFGLKGNKQKIYDQFAKLADEILHGHVPLPGHPEQPHAWKAGRDLPPGTHEHPPGMMQNNPSEPTYEPEYGREERQPGGGWVETALKGLFQTFDLWRRATEREGDDRYAGDLALDIKRIIHQMEDRGIEPPPHLARKFDFIRKMFMSGAYSNNPDLPKGWKSMNLADIVPKEAIRSLSSVIKTLQNELRKGRLEGRSAHQLLLDVLKPHEAYIESKGVDVKFLAYSIENSIRHGFSSNKHGYKDNPWLVAGPQVGFTDFKPGGDLKQVDASVKQIEIGQEQQPALPAPASDPSAPAEKVKRVLRPEEIERRRRSIRRQRRDRVTGKFYDNPGTEIYRPNPGDSSFTKVHESAKKGVSTACFVKYDPSWQLFTVRHVEEREGKKTGFEVDVAAHADEARRMWRFVKARGFAAFLKALKRASRPIRAKRAYEETATQVEPGPQKAPVPTWGGWGGVPHVATKVPAQPTMIPVQEELPFGPLPQEGQQDLQFEKPLSFEEDEATSAALNAVDQVKHEAGEGDYLGAIQNLMKIRNLMIRAQERGYVSAWHGIQSAFTRAREIIERTWPGKIRGIR